MIDLIFIIILAVFIGGMLWSDRDSRRVRWYERVNVSIAKFTQCGCSAQDLVSAFQALGRASRGMKNINIDIKEKIKLPDVTFK